MFDPRIHHRKSIRLPGYDYNQLGSYYITIVTQGRLYRFGEIVSGEMVLNQDGLRAKVVWEELPDHYRSIEMGKFIVMPNHLHGIITINENSVGAGFKPAPTIRHPLSEIIRGYKTFSTRKVNQQKNTVGAHLWQRNYYEHIIRDDLDYARIWKYIDENPACWSSDDLYRSPSASSS